MFCYSFVSSEGLKIYPKEINCIINKYITEFSNWEEFVGHISDSDINPLGWLLEDKIIERNQVISIRQFKISGGKGKRDCFWIKIWKMKSSADAERLFVNCNESLRDRQDFYLYKMPKRFFIVEDYFIWVNACSFATQFVVGDELDKIINMCFE